LKAKLDEARTVDLSDVDEVYDLVSRNRPDLLPDFGDGGGKEGFIEYFKHASSDPALEMRDMFSDMWSEFGDIVFKADGKDYMYQIADPKNIRSRFAAFDPAKADSADLLAMNGNPALSMLFAHNPETSERKPVPEIMSYEDLMKFYRAGGA